MDLAKEERTAVRGIKRLASIVSEICFAPGIKGKEGKKGNKAKNKQKYASRWRDDDGRYDRSRA